MKRLFVLLFVFGLFFMVGCTTNQVSFDEMNSNLEASGMDVYSIPNAKIQELADKVLAELPDIALPTQIMFAGKFSEELDLDAYFDGSKEFDVEKFAEEFEGVVVDFGSSVKANVVMGFKDDLLQAIKDNGIELTDDIKIEIKGSYIYIGYQEFIDCTYNYVPLVAEGN